MEYRGVLSLSRQARTTVGFLTDSAFAERANQGTLLAALIDGVVAGYVLYDLPRDEIRIVHLVVSHTNQGRGIARELVNRVADDHADRRGIFLHCRNDFPADSLWPRLDFEARGERPGRSFDGKPLTRWYRSFGQPDLFTYLDENDARPIATMNACIFFDLVSQDPRPIAKYLRADWLGEHVRVAVTSHLSNEIHRGKDGGERRLRLAAQEPFRIHSSSAQAWRPFLRRLLDSHPDAPVRDHDDLTHAAQSIAMGAAWLITDDPQFIRRYGTAIASIGGLQLVSPSGFLREIDRLARGDRYRPVDLAGTDVTRSEAPAKALRGLADIFVNLQRGERLRDARRTIDLAAAQTATVRLETVSVDGKPRALVACQSVDGVLRVPVIRATPGVGETTIARHVLAMVRQHAIVARCETICVSDQYPSATIAQSFRDEGFAAADGTVVAHALQGFNTMTELHARASALGSPLSGSELFAAGDRDRVQRAAQLERWFSPVRVIDAAIPSFFVPIRHGWATNLLDVGLAEEQLLPRPWGLGLRRELVYYRSSQNPRILPTPARLVWYVSGEGHGARSIRAVSHLTEVVVDRPSRLHHRFERLGVYDSARVASAADRTGMAMALRFCSTTRLDRPVELDLYRRLMTGDPRSKNVVLQSIRPLPEHVFVQIVKAGSRDET